MTTTIEVLAARGRLTWALARAAAAALILLAVLLSACGGGGAPPPTEGSATLGAAGGVVNGPDGVTLAVPAAALAQPTTIRIARDGSGAPEVGGAKLLSAIYSITPHGTAFAESARISIPFNPADVAPGTAPVLLRAQPGGQWTALATQLQGTTVSAADTSSLSFYAVGTCFTSRDITTGGPDPLLYCPAAHQLTLTLQDNSGVALPVPRTAAGNPLPAITISQPTALNYTVYWNRPTGTSRGDVLDVIVSGAGLLPAQQPVRGLTVNNNNFSLPIQTFINPATVPLASQPGGVVVRIRATVSYTVDSFYLGCVCFRPASWTFEAEVPVRVIYRGVQPTITQSPTNRAVTVGQTATFTVAASGQSLSYEWLRAANANVGSSVIAGATLPTYTTPATLLSDNGAVYSARACTNLTNPTERVCVISDAAQLSVSQVTVAPTFTTAPQSITVTDGDTVSLSAVANGQPAPTIGWSRLDSGGFGTVYTPVCALTTGTGSVTSATCNLGAMTLAQNGQRFIAAASNAAGNADSGVVTITVLARPVAPTITSTGELRDQTITAGGSVTWTVNATGTAPLSYTWYSLNTAGGPQAGVFCPDGSTPSRTGSGGTLTLSNVSAACNGMRLRLDVGNGAGSVTARIATLTANAAPAAPQITVPLANRAVLDNTEVTFNVGATGTPATFTYAWTVSGSPAATVVSGCTSTSATCTLLAQIEDSGRTVAVTVANGVAPNAQSSAVLTVTTTDVPASITTQPTSQSVVAGNTATFTIGTAGTPTPAVQWRTSTDGTNWTDAGTGASHVVSNAQTSQNGLRVRAVVTNTTRVVGGTRLNSVTSSTATLSVVDNVPANALTAVQVMTLGGRTMALRADGAVYAWGSYVDPVHGAYHTNGQFARAPTRVLGLGAVRQVAIGSDYASWALGQDGTVWGWGFLNSYEAFAQGPNDPTLQFYTPVRILASANTPIDRVCQIEGTVWGVVMVRSDVIGGTCAANEPRSVWYTGNISGNEGTSVRYAQRFNLLNSGGTLLPSGRWIAQVLTSRNHAVQVNSVFALANDGSVYAWGHVNNQGQLGLGFTGGVTTPTLAPDWAGATRIAAASEVTLALMPDGTIRGAGWNPSGNLGIGPVSYTVVSTPQTLPGISGAIDVGTSYQVSMALVGGDLRYWGNGGRFALGQQPVPIPIAAPVTPFSAVAVGTTVAFAIGPGGALYGWGDATYRGCGTFNVSTCNNPTTSPQLLTISP